jgi:hypothetical protein
MPLFHRDTFTDTPGVTALAHVPELGGGVTRSAAASNNTVSLPPVIAPGGQTLRAGETNTYITLVSNAAAPTADELNRVVFVVGAASSGNSYGVGGRFNASAGTGYYLKVEEGVPRLTLRKVVAGVFSYLGTPLSITLPPGTYAFEFDPLGSNVRGRVQRSDNQWLTSAGTWQVAKTECLTFTDPSPITAAGSSAIWLSVSNVANVEIAEWTAGTAGGPTISVQPQAQTVAAGGTVTVGVTAAASGGGTLGYQLRLDGVNQGASVATMPTTFTAQAADNGKQMSFVIAEIGGTNPGSVTSNNALLTVTGSSNTVPGAPTIGAATAVGNGAATVPFTVGVSGGTAILDTTVTLSPGGQQVTVTSATSGSASFTGLANGTPYTATAQSRNSVGNSAVSAPGPAFTPLAQVGNFTARFGPLKRAPGSQVPPQQTALCSVWVGKVYSAIGNGLGAPTFEQAAVSDASGIFTITGIASKTTCFVIARDQEGRSVYAGVVAAG